ncbi:hypothetical protein R6Q59_033512 [Mikania micrantha]
MQPDNVIGDILFVLQQKKHPKFKRKRDDIFVVHTLSLTEELCGFQFILTHLYNRILNLERLSNMVHIFDAVVVTKLFTKYEMMQNARTLREWITSSLGIHVYASMSSLCQGQLQGECFNKFLLFSKSK